MVSCGLERLVLQWEANMERCVGEVVFETFNIKEFEEGDDEFFKLYLKCL